MPTKQSRAQLQHLADEFLAVKTPDDLADLLEIKAVALHALALAPEYNVFHVPKKNGEQRLIEDPVAPLKKVQRRINRHLQAVYFFMKSEAAYGFVTNCSDDPPFAHRHIVSNAKLHLGAPWLLNMDVEDFFHFVKSDKIAWIFSSKPFLFDEKTTELLTHLCQKEGRLPMGAPTSPSLSNFAMHLMDLELENVGRANGWTYSRYADDLSFSGETDITAEHIDLIRGHIRAFGFEPNELKTRLFAPKDKKVVTGIVLDGEKLDLPEAFFEEIDDAIAQLSTTLAIEARYADERTFWTRDFEDQIRGMLEFAGFALGERHEKVAERERAFQKAIIPPDYRSVSWLDFPYPNW